MGQLYQIRQRRPNTDIQGTDGVTDREITMAAATQTIASPADQRAIAMRGQRGHGASTNPPIKVDYLEAGSSGPVVVLVHSSVSGARQWRRLMDDLKGEFPCPCGELVRIRQDSAMAGRNNAVA